MSYKFEKQEEYGLIPEGEYEVRIEKVELKTTPSGKEKIALMFRIRDDVEQQSKNRVVFEDIWKERGTDFYNRKRLNQLIGTQHIEDGTIFETVQDVMKVLRGGLLVAVVNQRHNEYYGKDENGISYYKSSNNLPKALGEKESSPSQTDDELPF